MPPVEDTTIIRYPLAPLTMFHVTTMVVPLLVSAVTDDGGGSPVMVGEGEGTRDGEDTRDGEGTREEA